MQILFLSETVPFQTHKHGGGFLKWFYRLVHWTMKPHRVKSIRGPFFRKTPAPQSLVFSNAFCLLLASNSSCIDVSLRRATCAVDLHSTAWELVPPEPNEDTPQCSVSSGREISSALGVTGGAPFHNPSEPETAPSGIGQWEGEMVAMIKSVAPSIPKGVSNADVARRNALLPLSSVTHTNSQPLTQPCCPHPNPNQWDPGEWGPTGLRLLKPHHDD